jgi:uncharacterized protein YuzE
MKDRYLEVTYRKGKPLAAYLYLPRREGDTSARTERGDSGLLIDYAADGRPIGIEITVPSVLSLEVLNRTLAALSQEPATREEMAPVIAA